MEGSRVTKEASGHTPQASRGTLEGSKDTRDEGYTGGEHQTRQDKTRLYTTQRPRMHWKTGGEHQCTTGAIKETHWKG